MTDGLETDENPIPTEVRITRIWPNPSSGVFRARFALPGTLYDAQVSLIDLAGRRVTQFCIDTPWNSDNTTVTFRIPDAVSNGIYMIRLANPETSDLMPIAIIR